MNKHTFAKWVLATVAMSFAYACQPSKPADTDTKPQKSSCGCTSTQSDDDQAANEINATESNDSTALQIIEIVDESEMAAPAVIEEVAQLAITPEIPAEVSIEVTESVAGEETAKAEILITEKIEAAIEAAPASTQE